MKLWRLTRTPFVALDGAGAELHGARYSSPGRPVVNFASEAGLAVLVALRYLPKNLEGMDEDYVLGWTEAAAEPERVGGETDARRREWVDLWLDSRRTLLASVPSKVLPEADVILMNPRHADAAIVPPLNFRPFSFAQCLHSPPMLETYRGS